jgi:L-lactate dehydrogenase complex protein LldG
VSESNDVLAKVRRALGHANGSVTPPPPPAIDDGISRMFRATDDLAGVFEKTAKEQKIHLDRTTPADVAAAVVTFAQRQPFKRIAIASSERLARLGVEAALKSTGFDVKRWDEISLDEMYEFDCAVTDVDCAVAENATLVVRPSSEQGRAMSLVPMFHIAIVETSQIMPDMIDLFERMGRDANRSNAILITGPSKTADIEMNVVTGVHGPNYVQVFLLP